MLSDIYMHSSQAWISCNLGPFLISLKSSFSPSGINVQHTSLMTVRTTIGCTSLKLFWNPHRIKSTYSLQLSRYGVHDPVPWVHYWTDSSAYYYDLWSFAYVTFLVLGLWFQCCFPVPHHACTVPTVSSSCLTFPNHTSLYLSPVFSLHVFVLHVSCVFIPRPVLSGYDMPRQKTWFLSYFFMWRLKKKEKKSIISLS